LRREGRRAIPPASFLADQRKQRGEAAQRFAERRSREDEAPRLRQQLPGLAALVLEIEERRRDGIVGMGPRHIKRIVVESAAALFVVPCGDPRCKEGGHDITQSVMAALRAARTRFEGHEECCGSQGNAPCDRVMYYVGIASYT
jgi:hypothetical protein